MRMFTKILGMTSEEVSSLTSRAARDIRSGKMHTYMAMYVVAHVMSTVLTCDSDFLWAQKPLDATR